MAAAFVLVALAAYGAYDGWRKSAAEDDVVSSTDGLLPPTANLSAKQAAPLQDEPAPILTEAQIRTIARQEAQAALSRNDSPPSEPAPSAPAPAPRTAPPAASAPAPQPAAPRPQPAPQTPPPANEPPPLF